MMNQWVYFNDICGCEITELYTQNALVEIVYLKEAHPRSLTLNYHVAGGSMGYVECFKCDSIPLPPSKVQHALSGKMGRVLQCNLYGEINEHTSLQEFEIVCEEGSYLFYFSEDEDEANYAKIEKNKAPSYPLLSCHEALFPRELFSVDFFKENLAFALSAHGEQKTPHGLPYSMHFLSVATEVINALTLESLSYDENNVAIACALLHDVNEDTKTRITRNTCLAGNVEVIAKGVEALTKNKALSTKEAQMKDSLERLLKRQKCVGLVKLADRITNLDVPPKHWTEAKKRAYCEEAKLILKTLGHTHHYLAQKLEAKIIEYEQKWC